MSAKEKVEETTGTEKKSEVKEIKPISIAALIAAADKVKESTAKERTLDIKVDRLEEILGTGQLKLEVPDMEVLMASMNFGDIAKAAGKLSSIKNIDIDADLLVYRCLIEPDIRSDELRKAFGVNKNIDVMKAILKPQEITMISAALMAETEKGVSIVNRIKN